MARNRVIGKNNRMPWHFPADLKHFKELTTGSTVIMGRKTFESLGRALPNRTNFILSRSSKALALENAPVRFFGSFEEARKAVRTEKAFVIGGGQVYRDTIALVDGIYLTRIDADYEGDAFYPEIPPSYIEEGRVRLQEGPKIEVICYKNTQS